MADVRVCLEVGKKRVVAYALDWPGWCRSGKGEADALGTLAAYAQRYAPVAGEAGLHLPDVAGVDAFDVVERLAAKPAYAEMGIPIELTRADREPLSVDEADRLARLVEAAWRVFDATAARTPAVLTKGPRGGGRDRDKLVDHVLGAEAAYARKLGVRHRQPAREDRTAIDAMRVDLLAALRAPLEEDAPMSNGWPRRYAARRVAWHVLDHTWEMEDRTPAA